MSSEDKKDIEASNQNSNNKGNNNNDGICTILKEICSFPHLGCLEWTEIIILASLNIIVGISCLVLAAQETCPGSRKLITFLIINGSIRLGKFFANLFHLMYYQVWYMGLILEGVFELFFMLFAVTYATITLKNQWEYNVLIENNAPNYSTDNNGCDRGVYVLSWTIVAWNILLLVRLFWRFERWFKKRYAEANEDSQNNSNQNNSQNNNNQNNSQKVSDTNNIKSQV